MKYFSAVTIAVIASLALASAADKKGKAAAFEAKIVIWAGIDYSMVRMIGPGFNDPDSIFPAMPTAWNDLFLLERLPSIEKHMKKTVKVDVEGVREANKKASKSQIIESPGPDDTIDVSHIIPKKIAEAVRGYKMKSKSGLGVVFIADRFVKMSRQAKGAVYVVCFDIATREVLCSYRYVSTPAGFGFRNYWFRVIKNSEPMLRHCGKD